MRMVPLNKYVPFQAGKAATISRDFSSWVVAQIFPLWALTTAEAMESPRP